MPFKQHSLTVRLKEGFQAERRKSEQGNTLPYPPREFSKLCARIEVEILTPLNTEDHDI